MSMKRWLIYWVSGFTIFMQDIKKFTEDLAELKPTIFIGVPRVFDRIYTGKLHCNVIQIAFCHYHTLKDGYL